MFEIVDSARSALEKCRGKSTKEFIRLEIGCKECIIIPKVTYPTSSDRLSPATFRISNGGSRLEYKTCGACCMAVF
jgi:hypothetical protein